MNTVKFLLQSAVSLIILFSASAYAIPILQVNGAGAADGDTYSAQYNDVGMSRPEADNVLFPVHPLWNGNTERNLLDDFSGLNLLYGLYSAFATPLLSPPVAGFTIFDLPLGVAANEDIGSGDDENTIIGFFVTLGLGPTDWEITEQSPKAAGQQAQPDQAPNNTVTPRGARAECSQRHYGQPQKSGLREDDLCFGGGGLSGAGSRGGGGSLAARSSGSGGNPGGGFLGGSGGGQGGGGPGGGVPGSNAPGSNAPGSNVPGSNGPGSNGPISNGPGGDGPGGGYTGPGGIGPGGGGPGDVDPPTTIPGEVGTIPEPATLVLLGLGLAGMCIVRGCKTASASRNQPYRN